ncbi:serine/threonine-protein phosphatase 6 regulatory ankyrin repeat subunit A-like, partial [Saccostrea cucullata]|uniref:serine/threonine-protein phosphatase 6 regulatory ankyrin repeat subunit A-like n=1 Tax=Saccostrea cuccullata TaxID=36930 RepID=UPI002ED2FB25
MNPNLKDGKGNSPLCLSLRTNAEDFRKLLVAGYDPFSKEENIIEKCVMSDDLSFLNVLLQEKGTTFICNSLFSKFWERQNDATFLRNRSHIAAVTLQMLSSPQELNVNVINRLRTTPLLYFCEQNEEVVVERLLERGADVNIRNNHGRTALHTVLHSEERQNESYEEFLNFLLIYKKHGGKLEDVDRNGNTPLMLFLKHGLYDFDDTQDKLVDLIDEIVSILACDGSTVRKRNNTGSSAIHIVSSKGWLSTMKILVQKGAKISEKDEEQNRWLHLSHMG